MEYEKVIKERTAVRRFKEIPINKQDLHRILLAGNLAPTAKNLQPQRIFVVETKEGLEKIDKVSPCRYHAQTVLMICSDKNIAFQKGEHSTYEMDACIVATHMMLEATNLGIDNIWIEMFDSKKLKEEFNLEKNIEPICLIPLGYRTDDYKENPTHNIRKNINEIVKYI